MAERTFISDRLTVRVFDSQTELATTVASEVHQYLVSTLATQGSAAIILATGNSQIRFLEALVRLGGVEWSRVTLFHMDEYLGIRPDHPASFRKYMRERVASFLKPKQFHYIEADTWEPIEECARYAGLLAAQPIDLCCLGIGENGHLAFNDPPVAEFNDPHRVKVVRLDDACKLQQVKEGHFPSLEAVPPYAITLTIPALMAVRKIVCIAPERRKAQAVRDALRGSVAPACPASILRQQAHACLYLDNDSAALLG